MKIPLIPAKVMKNWKPKIHIPRSLYYYQMSSSPFSVLNSHSLFPFPCKFQSQLSNPRPDNPPDPTRRKMDLSDIAKKLDLSDSKYLTRKAAELRRLCDVQFDSSIIGVVSFTIHIHVHFDSVKIN